MSLLFILLSSAIFSFPLHAKVEIRPYKKSSWDNSWNESLSKELDKSENMSLIEAAVDDHDLKELNCTGLNKTSDNELKKDFWVVFFSALARSESAFNTEIKSRAPKGGHGNYGLLQLSKRTARDQCGLLTIDELTDPIEHLRCGVKLMNWQLMGAPARNGKLLRPDLKGQLFGKHILLWGPLRQNDRRGRKLLVNWFKSHLDQLPFCQA